MSKKIVYRVCFAAQNQTYEVYARSVSESEMFGFIEIEELVFGEASQVLIDPSEEKLRLEFEGVKRSYIPLHNILRIDAMEKEGVAKHRIEESMGGNVAIFPTGIIKKKTDE